MKQMGERVSTYEAGFSSPVILEQYQNVTQQITQNKSLNVKVLPRQKSKDDEEKKAVS